MNMRRSMSAFGGWSQPVDATLYLPKGTDLSVYSQTRLNKVARQLNERPRKTLQFETPGRAMGEERTSGEHRKSVVHDP